jgi:phage terminase small subunit
MGAALTAKQERFVDEFIIDLNASAAAVRAGYSEKTAQWIGPRLVSKSHVAAAISQRKAERSERTKIDADWVLRTLAAEKTADLSQIFDANHNLRPIQDWPMVFRTGLVVGVESFEEYEGQGKDRRFVGMVRKVKLVDRTRHIELIGKHIDVQAFREQKTLTGPNGGPIPVAAVSMTPDEFRAMAADIAQKV